LLVLHSGEVEYSAGLSLQESQLIAVREDPTRPRLLLLSHSPVFTIGKFGDEKNVLDPHGIPVVRTDRGGDVTYHGPGQLVGYPILSLREHHIGIRTFVHRLEKALISTVSHFGIEAWRKDDCVGVWTEQGKLASIGVRVDQGVTRHGFALQVRKETEPYTYINPCGIPSCAMTSMEELCSLPTEQELRAVFVAQFLSLFHISRSSETPFPKL